MGAGASTAIPDQFTEDQIKVIVGDKFDQAIYDRLKDENGCVSKTQFLIACGIMPDYETEAESVFNKYCHHGEMDSNSFNHICLDLKILNKQFPKLEADTIFNNARNAHGKVTWSVFRSEIVPQVAEKKQRTEESLIKKLAAAEDPRFYEAAPPIGGFRRPVPAPATFKNDLENADQEQHNAALKLQNAHRSKIAQKQVQELKEIGKVATADTLAVIDKASYEPHDEDKVKVLFGKFCPNGEMDSKTFRKFCADCNLMDKNFMSSDVEVVFQKTKVTASNPNAGSLVLGVIHGKRITYEVFRAVAIPCIAERKSINIAAVLGLLSTQTGPVDHVDEDASKQHHQESGDASAPHAAADHTNE